MLKRFKQHMCGLRNQRHHNMILQRMYNKNPDKLRFEILEEVEEDFLQSFENYWMIMLKPRANIAAANGHKPHNEAAKKKMSEYHKNRPESHNRKISESRKRNKVTSSKKGIRGVFKHTEEAKRKIGLASKGNTYGKGRVCPEEEKKRKSEAYRGKINTKTVIDRETGIIYNSLKEAASALDKNYQTLSMEMTGVRKKKTSLEYINGRG